MSYLWHQWSNIRMLNHRSTRFVSEEWFILPSPWPLFIFICAIADWYLYRDIKPRKYFIISIYIFSNHWQLLFFLNSHRVNFFYCQRLDEKKFFFPLKWDSGFSNYLSRREDENFSIKLSPHLFITSFFSFFLCVCTNILYREKHKKIKKNPVI